MSPWFLVALFLCPAGAVVDRVEGDAVVVLGASGVHVVARAALITAPARRVHEGDRVLAGPGGGCRAVPPSRAEVDRLRQRLRALGTR